MNQETSVREGEREHRVRSVQWFGMVYVRLLWSDQQFFWPLYMRNWIFERKLRSLNSSEVSEMAITIYLVSITRTRYSRVYWIEVGCGWLLFHSKCFIGNNIIECVSMHRCVSMFPCGYFMVNWFDKYWLGVRAIKSWHNHTHTMGNGSQILVSQRRRKFVFFLIRIGVIINRLTTQINDIIQDMTKCRT